MKRVKKIVVIIVAILLGLLLTYNIYNLVSLKIMKKDIASINGYAVLEVVSGSMEPTINVGDMIIINTKVKNYQKGDIVTFYDEAGAFVTHRIIEEDNEMVTTKGDSNNTSDKAINKSRIVGKYVFKIKNGGRILASFKSPLSMVMILIVGVLFCIFISMDKDGNPILDEEEKEFQEYLKNKKEKKKSK